MRRTTPIDPSEPLEPNLFNLLNGGGPVLRTVHAVHLTANYLLSFLPARSDFLYNEDKEQGAQNS